MIPRTKPLRRGKRHRARRKGKVAATRRKLNLMWSEIIRRSNGGKCWMFNRDHLECEGPIQAAHCFGKKALPAVRFELWNGVPLCRSHHCMYTYQVEGWGFVLLQAWGLEAYTERYRLAAASPNHDYAAIAIELAQALEQVA